jgi:hypothetical protein
MTSSLNNFFGRFDSRLKTFSLDLITQLIHIVLRSNSGATKRVAGSTSKNHNSTLGINSFIFQLIPHTVTLVADIIYCPLGARDYSDKALPG